MNKIKTVFGFEYMGYIKSKPFIITTIIFVAIILVGSQVPSFMGLFGNVGGAIGGGDGQKALLQLTDSKGENYSTKMLSEDALNAATGGMYDWEAAPQDPASTGDPEKLVTDDQYSVVVVYSGGDQYEIYGKGQDMTLPALPSMLDPLFTDAARADKMSGMTAEQQAATESVLGTQVAGEVNTVGGGGWESNYWLGYVMLFVLFYAIIIYAQFIVNSVISEKSSKMMELLITSAKPIQLMFGKVLGLGCVAFTQIGAIIIAVAVGFASSISLWEKNIPGFSDMLAQVNFSAGLFVFFILFFVIGYFLYAFICAAMGSTASRVEDAGAVSTIPMMLAVASFIVSIFSMVNIDAAYVKVLSFIPLFSPWIMFSRLCMASATFTEAAIAVAILVATVIFFGWLASKIYRVGIMMYGKPMKLREVLKAVTHS